MESHWLSKYEWIVCLFMPEVLSTLNFWLLQTHGVSMWSERIRNPFLLECDSVSNHTLRNWEASSNWAEQEWSLSVSFHTYRPCQDRQDSYSFLLSFTSGWNHLHQASFWGAPAHRTSSYWVCPDISNLLASVTGTPDGAGWREAAWGVTMEIMFSRLAV